MRRERGAAAVEFALVVPLLLVIIFGIAEIGTYYQRQIQLSNAAMLGARSVAHGGTVDQARTVAADAAEVPTTAVTVGSCSTSGTSVLVQIASTKASLTGMFGAGFDISGKGAARCE